MTGLLVLGIGSPFGADQLGWQVVNLLEKKFSLSPHLHQGELQLTCYDRPALYLLELIKEHEKVFIIDAIVSKSHPQGSILCLQNEDIEAFSGLCSSHELGVAEALKFGQILRQLPRTLRLYGITVKTAQLQFAFPTDLHEAKHQLALQIEQDILAALAQH
ncbi:hydrogenase maturation protease [Legionella jordanis]|uniref:Hydrogenase expression/formation protein n=1 Tax=Legionella jordanis TaxID=456 RepID=A0A0W0VGK1_9GAMM|nr:hydrogenase maturation protease [Legionella jordanis]KTD19234.1 hydrogenase expression/formation protein [Legionella jordanis]RMW99830.1 hydrogenase maturation protease [Legionella jordanis]VEH12880.1 hydrogenase expression/formation protein [Legionella jordanis]